MLGKMNFPFFLSVSVDGNKYSKASLYYPVNVTVSNGTLYIKMYKCRAVLGDELQESLFHGSETYFETLKNIISNFSIQNASNNECNGIYVSWKNNNDDSRLSILLVLDRETLSSDTGYSDIYGRYMHLDGQNSNERGYIIIYASEKCKQDLDTPIHAVELLFTRGTGSMYTVSFTSSWWRLRDQSSYTVYRINPIYLFDHYSYSYRSRGSNISIALGEINLVKQVIGSMLLYKVLGSEFTRQFPGIVYNPSYNTVFKKGGNNRQIINLSPIQYLSNSGYVKIHIKLGKELFDELKNNIKYHIVKALEEMLGKINSTRIYPEYSKPIDVFGEERDQDYVKKRILYEDFDLKLNIKNGNITIKVIPKIKTLPTASTYNFDPKALLKALLYDTINMKEKYGGEIIVHTNIRSNRIIPKDDIVGEAIKRTKTARFKYKCIGEASFTMNSTKYRLCYSRMIRFEDTLLEILKYALRFHRGRGYNINTSLFYAYLGVIIKKLLENMRIEEKIDKNHNKKMRYLINIWIDIDVEAMAEKIALRYLELGLHALAHILKRIVAAKLNMHQDQLGELIWIRSNRYQGNELVDNYIVRERHSRGIYEADVIVYSLQSNSRRSILELKDELDNILGETLQWARKLFSDDNRYNDYLEWSSGHATRLRMNLLNVFHISRGNYSLRLSDVEDYIALYIQGYKELRYNRNIDVRRLLYVPLTDQRRIYIRALLENLQRSHYSKDAIKRILEDFKIYLPTITEYYTPKCFDGCYRCILSRECEMRNGFIREWSLSKDALNYIIQILDSIQQAKGG